MSVQLRFKDASKIVAHTLSLAQLLRQCVKDFVTGRFDTGIILDFFHS